MDSTDLVNNLYPTPDTLSVSMDSESDTGANQITEDDKTSLTYFREVIIISILFYTGCVCFSAACSVLKSQVFSWSQVNQTTDSLRTDCSDGLADGSGQFEQFFALDITFGHNFTFAQAKLLDVTWDTVIGQGGRLIHGVVLYQTIIRRLLLFAMEHSTVTYEYFITISFTQSSFETLWVMLKSFRSGRSPSVILCTILLVYALLYTLFFTVIWSTATGYLSLSHRMYTMPDGKLIPLNTEDLAICWSLDPRRLGRSNKTVVEIGMNFSTIGTALAPTYDFTSHAILDDGCDGPCGLKYTSGGWKTNVSSETIWDYFGISSGLQNVAEQSENFRAIRAYALTAQLLKISLNPSFWVSLGDPSFPDPIDWIPWQAKNTRGYCLDWWCQNHNDNLNILQYEIPEQQRGLNGHYNDSQNIYPSPYNESGLEKVSWATFTRNASTVLESEYSGNSNLRYNSTLWFNNSLIPLSSPFLDVGYGCSGRTNFTTLGNCICYKGQPIPPDLLNVNHAVCKTAPGYVWGFSSRLTVLGMALEAAWMGCCFILYLYLSFRSKSIRNATVKTAGTLRLAMDLTESVQRDLGGDTACMLERRAKERLKSFRIGYEPETIDSNDITRYRLVSGLPDKTSKERIRHGLRFIRQLRRRNAIGT